MDLLCIGISHRSAPLDVREKLWFSDNEALGALQALKAQGFVEAVLFSTCNRTELYAVATPAQASELKDFLIAQKDAQQIVPASSLFVLEGIAAVHHIFEVAAGIDSMIVGDVQILSQVKDGYHRSRANGTLGFLLDKVFQSAFHVGKRVRTETNISEGAISISYAAVELAGKIFDRLAEKTALVIGAGETAELTAKHLRARDIGHLLITNRTQERAEALAQKMGGVVLPFDSFRHHLASVDIIISSVETKEYILSADEIARINRLHTSTALFIIDIGVPRNVDPEARKLENVFLYDIDGLQSMVEENIRKRGAAVPAARQIVEEEVRNFSQWHSSLEANPTIVALRNLAEQIRKEEVEKNLNRFQPADRELLEVVTKRIVNKLLHTPLVNLKNGQEESANERIQKIALVRKLFGLDAKDRVNGS